MPWSPAKERAGDEQCNRLSFRGVDDVLHVNLHAGWEPYNSAGVSQVAATHPSGACSSLRLRPAATAQRSTRYAVRMDTC